MTASVGAVHGRVQSNLSNLYAAFGDLLDQEFAISPGHVTAILNTCVFAPSIFTFWLINGVIDFSTAIAIGSVQSPGGLAIRLLAYILLVPVFLGLRIGYYLAHPVHRKTIFAGACPQAQLLSLDWFSVGILATGLPLALQNLGSWVASNAVYLLGLFVLPPLFRSAFVPGRLRTERVELATKVSAIFVGTLVFAYANYGSGLASILTFVPDPATVVGPAATLRLTDPQTTLLVRTVNSFAIGPFVVALFALAMNRVLTHHELKTIPLVRKTLPHRDPARVVLTSAALGTIFYLAIVALTTGQFVVLP